MVFDKADDSTVLHRDVHVKVFDVDIQVTDSLLINLTLLVQLRDHLFQICNVFRVFSNACCVFVNLGQLGCDLVLEISKVVDDPTEDSLEILCRVLQSEHRFEVERAL